MMMNIPSQFIFFNIVLIGLLFSINNVSAADPDPLQDFCVAELNTDVIVNGFVCKNPINSPYGCSNSLLYNYLLFLLAFHLPLLALSFAAGAEYAGDIVGENRLRARRNKPSPHAPSSLRSAGGFGGRAVRWLHRHKQYAVQPKSDKGRCVRVSERIGALPTERGSWKFSGHIGAQQSTSGNTSYRQFSLRGKPTHPRRCVGQGLSNQ
eukprot:Gb_05079 [translate_table: standard]